MIIKILFVCLIAGVFASEADKDLLCPTLPEGTIGICLEGCSGDASCPAGQKCCSNGCGHTCQNAVKPPSDPCATVKCSRRKKCQVNPSNNTAICVNKYCDPPKKLNCQSSVEYCIDYEGCLSGRCSNCNCSDSQLMVRIPSHIYSNKRCVCIDPCEGACPSGYTCQLNQVQCIRAPCPPIPQCLPIFNPCSYGQPLPNVFCGRGPSHQDCPNGYECNVAPDDRYALCCQTDPCNNTCASTERCILKQVQCITTPCLPQPTCVPKECPLYKCVALDCPYGYAFDECGCKTCGCLDPCKNKVCEKGKTCTAFKAPLCTDRECPQYYGLCV